MHDKSDWFQQTESQQADAVEIKQDMIEERLTRFRKLT
jgi:hypothetical protein